MALPLENRNGDGVDVFPARLVSLPFFGALLTAAKGSAILMAKREGCDGHSTEASMGEEPGPLFFMERLTSGNIPAILMVKAGLDGRHCRAPD